MVILSEQQHQNVSSNAEMLSKRVTGFATIQTAVLNEVATPVMQEQT